MSSSIKLPREEHPYRTTCQIYGFRTSICSELYKAAYRVNMEPSRVFMPGPEITIHALVEDKLRQEFMLG